MEAWKANAEKEEESFLKILHSRMETSSAHGLPNIHRSSKSITKLFWLLLFLTGIGVITWQVIALFKTYFAYEYTVSLEIKFNRSQEFPAITICNMNPVMKSKLEKADDSFRELFDTNFQPPGPMDMVDQVVQGVGQVGGVFSSGVGSFMGSGGNSGGGVEANNAKTTQRPGSSTAGGRRATDGNVEVAGSVEPPNGPSGPLSSQGQSDASATTLATSSASSDTSTSSMFTAPGVGSTTESTGNTTEAVETWQDRQKGDFFRKQSNDYLKQQRLMVKLANKTIEERKSLGHSLDDMLLDCSWRGFPCSPANFTNIFDPQFGNCYIFNSGLDGDTLTTNRPGPNYGLSMELFVQQDEYMEDQTEVAGFRVIIHHPSNMPFPSDDGIFVSPGMVTAIGVRVVEIERLPEPYGLCKEDTKENIEDNIYYQNYNMSYSIQTCEQSCYQRAMIRICGCSDPSYPSPLYHNETFYPCDIDNDKETSCLHETGHRYENGSLGCVCQTACHDFSYLPTISSATWPSDNYEKKLFEKMIRSNEEMKRQIRGQSPSVWTRSNMAKLEIYFDEFNYEYIRQDPAYTIPDLLSDMGGQLGLWLGLSVITIFEIFEGVWVMISFFCSRNRSRTRPMQTIPTSTFKARAEKSPPPAYDAAYDAHFAEKK
eukprot:XP_011670359.1 PREDICTED: amiloride-sensitive sodium channel subunit beta-like [Strongylocentrotus purpuratus]